MRWRMLRNAASHLLAERLFTLRTVLAVTAKNTDVLAFFKAFFVPACCKCSHCHSHHVCFLDTHSCTLLNVYATCQSFCSQVPLPLNLSISAANALRGVSNHQRLMLLPFNIL